ncbi:putative ubiquitin conjugating enzyme (UbcK) [Aspergillus affinis]|uniref:putative ubiquitin conjugating enzyme (UbcK) n=1 Tax=Aspergillus affinis TaxID=1070780 RepID=UPI0022FE9F25|nr:ubiquitin-conjugating enzyme E2-20 kDa [Aspergillus affinis]KAI9040132.1 ubiquitin-conjugating enzyme E2-20 kDa [Aspergillus affinis]
MDYTMEDTQNSAPDALEASKLNSAGQRNDSQSVTKRFVPTSPPLSSYPSSSELTSISLVFNSLQAELMQLMLSPSPGISAFPDADGNLLSWTATITGPADTPYDGLKLKLSFAFPSNYPYAPPTVLFKTPIYHPNFDFSGRICLDILKDKWSAVYNVQSVLLSLQSLLGEPNNASPLNAQAAELWDTDQEEFKRHVLARHRDIEDIE